MAVHSPGAGESWSPWFAQRVRAFPTSGTPKWQEVPWGMGTGNQAYRGMLRQPGEKSSQAKQEDGVLPWSSVPSWQPLVGPRVVVESLACTQHACLLHGGTPKQQGTWTGHQAWKGTLRHPGKKVTRPRRMLESSPRGQCLSGSPWAGPEPGGHGVPGLHPGCITPPWEAPQSGKKSPKGQEEDAMLTGGH